MKKQVKSTQKRKLNETLFKGLTLDKEQLKAVKGGNPPCGGCYPVYCEACQPNSQFEEQLI